MNSTNCRNALFALETNASLTPPSDKGNDEAPVVPPSSKISEDPETVAISRKASPWMKAWRMTSTARAARTFATGPSSGSGSGCSVKSRNTPGLTKITTKSMSQAATNGHNGHINGRTRHSEEGAGKKVNGNNGGTATLKSSKLKTNDQGVPYSGNDTELGPWSECHLPTRWGDFRMRSYKSGTVVMHVGIVGDNPDPDTEKDPLIRIHSECVTSEIFGSLRCDCAYQLEESLRRMADEGHGALIYLKQEGRGLGLYEKIRAYGLQEEGYDTVDANLMLGHAVDYRTYDHVAPILESLGLTHVRLLTNNPEKIAFVQGACEKAEVEPIKVPPVELAKHQWMKKYVKTKREKCAHRL